MAEEAINPSQDTGETVTSASGNEDNNNTATASEGVTTQQTGRTAQERIAQLIRERDDAKAEALKYKPAAESQSSSPSQGSTEDTVLELIAKVPDHLKGEMANIARYAKEHIMSVEDAILLFDSKNRVPASDADAIIAANQAANDSKSGGTPNPAARQEQTVYSDTDDDTTKTAKLRAEIEKRIASGEKF